ncbi:putative reverse transcriptase domain-containing protein [Tanacetum coccineum]
MPKFNKWLSSLLRNKEKLEEIAITTVNAECSAIIMNKVPEKLEDPGKFLIPCALQELDRTSALADSGASINLLPHSIYKQLGLEALTPTRMTLELANRSITHPMGIAEDVVVRVDETLTLRIGKEELVYYADKSKKNKDKHFVHAISIIDFSKDDPFSGSTTIPSDAPFPSSSPKRLERRIVHGTDISKIIRKQSKTGKHGHGKRKSTREAKDSKPKPEKVKLQSNGQTSSELFLRETLGKFLIALLEYIILYIFAYIKLSNHTASEEVPIVSTAEVNLSTAGGTVTYSRRSEEQRKRKDKGKAIMTESEPKKKSKKELEQERLSFAEAIRLEEQMNEEQRAQIARDEEIARQWDEEERQRAMSEAKTSKKIDWNDPSVIRYHTLKMKPKTVAQARRNMIKYLKNQGNYKISDFKGMSYNEIRPIFEKVWDFNQHIEPMDSEHGSEIMKSPEKMKSAEKIEEEDVATQKEMKEVSKGSGAKRKKSIPRKSTRKRQKMEEDAEKEELKGFLDIIPREEVPIEVESISTNSKNYKVLSEMLEDFDRQDVEELYRLVKEKYSASRLEGFDLMLWGDLYVLFESDEEDEIWKSQHEYNLISWRLCDFCGIHILLMENGLAIHMLTEKKYPLSQEMISKMLKKKLEVDHESSQAIELLRFIRSQVQK